MQLAVGSHGLSSLKQLEIINTEKYKDYVLYMKT